MKRTFFTWALCLLFAGGSSLWAQSTHKLWYNQPAQYFEETLVLGNGRMGASVFGGVKSDKIYLNDITLWSGEPVKADSWANAYKDLPAVREALKNEDYELAEKLNRKLQGKNSESYAPLGTLHLHFDHQAEHQKYYRELDIAHAVSKVEYEVNGVKFTREYFISHPDKVMAIRLTSSKKGALNFHVKFESLLKNKVSTTGNILSAKGSAHIGNNQQGPVFDDNRGTRFSAMAKIKNTGGKLFATDSTLVLQGATEAIVYVSVATSFNGFDKDPSRDGLNDAVLAAEQMDKATKKSFKSLKNAHMEDYHQFFNRVSLDLGATDAPDLPTNERLLRYAEGKEDKNLEVLYFQYGRYLLISASRTPGVPANLQGLWNHYIHPPWRSNYTMNINVEENYWLAENTNLSEMHQPLLSFIKNVSETGKVTARTFYGINGWAACHNSDIWAMSNPVGNGNDEPMWACWNMGGAWLSTHLWEHYRYTQDREFLKNHAYELMKGAARFCLEWMVEDKDGKLITLPSTSPENKFIAPSGFHGATLYGGFADIAMIRACMEQAVEASKVLDVDADFRQQLESALSRLLPYRIGKKGQLQEWYYDWEDEDPRHRHQSHLFGLYPGHDISPLTTPELADACRKTLEIKGDETTGWSKGWRINLWARLLEGNHAYQMYRTLLRYVDPDGVKDSKHRGGGTYPNLFDAHPPFQIDGNFGGAAAVAEMLMQSTEKEIRLLPALPDAWAKGSVKGICARGGFEIAMEWDNKTLKRITVTSKNGGTTNLICGDKQKSITLAKGKQMEIEW
ncbi:MAG TPA: glycoside hydrolase family 95 protein [Prolixibacteraceae bacterium]|nr:glycoside hydrolase family 95 protein [Prolixibacteraceae bacterium]